MSTPLGLSGASQCRVISVADGLAKVKNETGPGAGCQKRTSSAELNPHS